MCGTCLKPEAIDQARRSFGALVCHGGALRHAPAQFRSRRSPNAKLNAGRIEIDIRRSGGDYVVPRQRFETHTTQARPAGRRRTACRRCASSIGRGVPLLSEVIDLARSCDRLQLDWKDLARSPARLRALGMCRAGRGASSCRRRTGTCDGCARRHGGAQGVGQGTTSTTIERHQVVLPRQIGAYGYRDDTRRSPASGVDYLIPDGGLSLRAPGARGGSWFPAVLPMLDDGFNPAASAARTRDRRERVDGGLPQAGRP
jgi:hypothetical protein